MNVKKLKALLSDMPDHLVIHIDTTGIDHDEEFNIVPIESAEVKKIRFHEGNTEGHGPESYQDVVVLKI